MPDSHVHPPIVSNLQDLLEQAFRVAIVAELGDEYTDVDPLIRPSQNPEFGDFQSNVAMSLSKRLGEEPRTLAQRIASAAAELLIDYTEAPSVAGPGFINIQMKRRVLAELLATMHERDLGIEKNDDTHSIVIDMCSVNVAKQMHVGHLRSTIIGDALARVFERLGRTVYRQNHLGDWGLQIGMVLHMLRLQDVDLDSLTLTELERAYRSAHLSCKADSRGMNAAIAFHAGPHRLAELEEQNAGADDLLADVKRTLVNLQNGEAEYVRDWKKLIAVTMRAVYNIIDTLGVRMGPESERGESFYRERLGEVVDSFVRNGYAHEDDGAIVVSFEDRQRPLLIRKSDGGYLYATTDLAAIRYRTHELNAGRVIYIVDARQRDHFKDVFDAARKAKWHVTDDEFEADLLHIPFGQVLGDDKRPLKTREGENITLKSLLDEAIACGVKEVRQRAEDPAAPTHELTDNELAKIGQAVGIGAVKYADLSNDLSRDYVFSFKRMIAFEGNTGPYIQYAHARICSIIRKAGLQESEILAAPMSIDDVNEKNLALLLLRYRSVVNGVASSLEPHRLCTYLYDLANAFSAFYQACPVVKANDEPTKQSRLHLCTVARDVIRDGLDLLGIESPQRM